MKSFYLLCVCVLLFSVSFGQIVDKLYLKDNSVIDCKVIRQDEDHVYYYRIEDTEKKELSIKKSDISFVVYANGDNEIFNLEENEEKKYNRNIGSPQKNETKAKKKENNKFEAFVVKNKVVIKPGVGIGNVFDMFDFYEIFDSDGWIYYQKISPISINLDFGIGSKLMLGPVFTLVKYHFEKDLVDTLHKYSFNFFCLGFQSKFYPEFKSNRVRPYLRGGINYYSENHEYFKYGNTGNNRKSILVEKDRNIYVGWISMLGIDFMITSSLGIYVEGGWGTSYFISGFSLKF